MSTIDLGSIKLLRLIEGTLIIGSISTVSTTSTLVVDNPHELQIVPTGRGEAQLFLMPYGSIPGVYNGKKQLTLTSVQVLFVEDNVPEALINNFVKATSNIQIATPGDAARILKP